MLEKNRISYTKAKNLFRYNIETGQLFWKIKKSNSIDLSKPAGCLRKDGYWNVRVDDKLILNHRIVWLIHYGYLPENDIDHINMNRSDNRICNLREISRSCNIKNSGNRKDNSSGIKGVSFDRSKQKWVAVISQNKVRYAIGNYDQFDDAVLARAKKEIDLCFYKCNSLSSAISYCIANKLLSVNSKELNFKRLTALESQTKGEDQNAIRQ